MKQIERATRASLGNCKLNHAAVGQVPDDRVDAAGCRGPFVLLRDGLADQHRDDLALVNMSGPVRNKATMLNISIAVLLVVVA